MLRALLELGVQDHRVTRPVPWEDEVPRVDGQAALLQRHLRLEALWLVAWPGGDAAVRMLRKLHGEGLDQLAQLAVQVRGLLRSVWTFSKRFKKGP